MPRRLLVFSLPLLFLSCGNPLVGNDFRGDPLFTFQGRLTSYLGGEGNEPDFFVSLFWSPSGRTRVAPEELVEQLSATATIQFPATFEINIFHPPQSEHLVQGPVGYGLALVLVYEDLDGNGHFTRNSAPSELVGGAKDQILLYAPRSLTAEQSPTGLPVPAGFSLVPIPLNCDQEFQPQTGDQDCGPDLGARCESDSDCPGGTCMQSIGSYEIDGGYCSLKVADDGCAPKGGTAAQTGEAYWLRACASNLDCLRPGYTCTDLDTRLERACKACWPADAPVLDSAYCTSYQNWYADPECGKKLGSRCEQDSDCAYDLDEGRCLHELGNIEFDGGYCTHANTSFGCTPFEGRWLVVYTSWWFRSCLARSDCRVADGHTCDPVYHICIPQFPMQLEIYPHFSIERDVEPLCF